VIAIFTPKPEALLHVMKESELQREPAILEKLIRTDEEGLANPKPEIATKNAPVVGTIAGETIWLDGFK
jgi:hypothetical protein